MNDRSEKWVRSTKPPFWLPASSYYFLVFGLSVGSFFLVILVLHEGGSELEVVPAGLASSGVLIIGVVVRELILRGVRENRRIKQQMLDRNLRSATATSGEFPRNKKFTLEDNSAALSAIRQRSDAAKIFEHIAAGHREVFELCESYSRTVSAEIPLTHPDSPRFTAMVKGKRQAGRLQEYHLLKWAEIESKHLTERAIASEASIDRADYVIKARRVIELALSYYPENRQLRDSEMFLENLFNQNDAER